MLISVYIANPLELEECKEILQKKGLKFNTWVNSKIHEEVEANGVSSNSQNNGNYGKCEYPRIKRLGLDCSWKVCPLLSSRAQGYGEVAQKREFEAREKCLFRLSLINQAKQAKIPVWIKNNITWSSWTEDSKKLPFTLCSEQSKTEEE